MGDLQDRKGSTPCLRVRKLRLLVAPLVAGALGVSAAVASAAPNLRHRSHHGSHITRVSKPQLAVKYVAEKVEIRPGAGAVVLACPNGYYPVSGGYDTSEDTKVQVVGSFPYNTHSSTNPIPNGWNWNINSTNPANTSVVVNVVCLKGATIQH
jgi:hypothetical protein